MKSGVVIGIIVVVVVLILVILGIVLLSKRGRGSNSNYTQKMKDEIKSVSEDLNTKAKGKVTNGELDLYYNDDPTSGFYSLYDIPSSTMYIGEFTGDSTDQGFGVYLGKPTEKIIGESVTTTDIGNIADLVLVTDGKDKFNVTVDGLYEVIGMTYNELFDFRVRMNN